MSVFAMALTGGGRDDEVVEGLVVWRAARHSLGVPLDGGVVSVVSGMRMRLNTRFNSSRVPSLWSVSVMLYFRFYFSPFSELFLFRPFMEFVNHVCDKCVRLHVGVE